MNIYGIGTDIVNINRIRTSIKKNKNAFKTKVFTNFEIQVCDKRANKVECYAKRFAAKEALFKAIGLKNKLNFKDVEIRNNTSGLPNFLITGKSLINLKKIFKNKRFKIHLSLSDDKPWAVASVIVFLYK
jgi:holo-[acyl-carrier protein] synthase|tara:strand:+ start:292 stop:681 length:390 start_codon:yes stop_codon:yes gene_type:complete